MIELKTIMERMEKYNRFDNLNSAVAAGARKLIELAYAEGIPIQITTGYRSNAESNKLYTQGRTTAQVRAAGISGLAGQPSQPRVSNAKGGESYHNYGLALDFVLLSNDGKDVIWTVNAKWKRVAAIGKSLGFTWGGDWSGFKDNPHLEMNYGLSVKDLQKGKRPTAAQTKKALDKVKSIGKPAAAKPAAAKKPANKLTAETKPAAIPAYPGRIYKYENPATYYKDVERIQRAVGLKESQVDGYFGKSTKAAVKAYQERKGLVSDGIVGRDTWNMMF